MVQVAAIIAQRKPDLAPLIDTEMKLRLQDPEWEVRRLAVQEVCDVGVKSLETVGDATLREVGERMKDKKVIIRKEAMTGLAQVYAAAPPAKQVMQLAWIPDYVLKCFAYPQQELKLRTVQLLDDIILPKPKPTAAGKHVNHR